MSRKASGSEGLAWVRVLRSLKETQGVGKRTWVNVRMVQLEGCRSVQTGVLVQVRIIGV